MKYHIWSEGFATTGQSGQAMCHTDKPIEAESFNEAVRIFADANPDFDESLVRHKDGRWTYWGCNLFDNETDARKSFG
jgi:hypothetical protein